MPICEILTAKGRQLGYARIARARPLQETIDAAWQDAEHRMEGK
jgi:hypothetical protein